MNETFDERNPMDQPTSPPEPGRDRVHELKDEASAQVENARLVLDDLDHRFRTFVRERPGTAILGALALGYVVGKLASLASRRK